MKRYFTIISCFLSCFFLWHGAVHGVDTLQLSDTQATRRGAENLDLEKCYSKILRRIGSVDDGTCCDSILGILGDACEILGRDASISGTLLDLCEKFSNITDSLIVIVDLNGIFTIIDGIEQRLCDKFEGVFTVLETLLIEKEGGFNSTFTLLDVICDKLESITGAISLEIDIDAVFTVIDELEETLCDKFEGIFTVLDDILDTTQDGFNATFTILDRLCEKIESITGTLLLRLDITGIFTAINELEEGLCDKFEGVFTTLEIQGLCDPVPLTQDDVVGGVITLDIEGINYCLAENIIGDIEITGNNINLDMNNRVLFGVIAITANEVTVENGKLRPPAPLDTVSANIAAVTINSENIVLRDLLIVCEDTTVANVGGRSGVQNFGNKTQIIDCSIKTGSAFGSTNLLASFAGTGVMNFGENLQVINCLIETGNGGDELIVGGVAGDGGNGIVSAVQEETVWIKNCVIKTGFGGAGLALPGRRGGDGIRLENGSHEVVNCKIITGNGGQGEIRGESGDGINASDQARSVIVEGCFIETGVTNFTIFGGVGINYQGSSLLKVSNSCIITGSGVPNSAPGIIAFSSLCNELSHLTIKTGDASNGGNSANGILSISSGSIDIDHCYIITGNGGNNTAGNGGFSEKGIVIFNLNKKARISNSSVITGDGGDSIGGTGGIASAGISSGTIDTLDIENCMVQLGDPGIGTIANGVKESGIEIGEVQQVAIRDTVIYNALNGIEVVNSQFCIKNCIAKQCTGNGFFLLTLLPDFSGVVQGSVALECEGDGFFLDGTNFQLLSNKALSNGGIGFNNISLMPATISAYNNVASMNVGGNFSGVANVEAAPMEDTRFYANVIA